MNTNGVVTVNYETQPDTAIPGVDYIAQKGLLTFADGVTEQTISIPLVSSTTSQPSKQFFLTILTPTNAVLLAPRTATVTILGDVTPAPQPVTPAPAPPDLSITPVDLITGVKQPTALAWLPDGTMLIALKGGVVRVASGSTLLPTPFIDISNIVNSISDRGLLSIAVHPNFSSNPYVYLLFTYEGEDNVSEPPGTLAGPDGGGARAARLIRVTANAQTNYRTADPNTAPVVILGRNSTRDYYDASLDSTRNVNLPEGGLLPNGDFVQDFVNSDCSSHTIGDLAFDPDGWLYVSVGDGANYNTVDRRAVRVQKIDSLSGKILRIDPITGGGVPSNPYYENDPNANRAKVYQMGLRNPFRTTMDKSTGQLYIGDVGWTTWEEVNTGGKGANFGWPYYEGAYFASSGSESRKQPRYAITPEGVDFFNNPPTVVTPIYALNHQTDGINAIALGDKISTGYYGPQYQGDLLLNDLGQGIVRHISFDASGNFASVGEFTRNAQFFVDMREGPDGAIYYASLYGNKIGRWEYN